MPAPIRSCIRCAEALPDPDEYPGAAYCHDCSCDPRRGIELLEAEIDFYDDDPPEKREEIREAARAMWAQKRKAKWRKAPPPQDDELKDVLVRLADLAGKHRDRVVKARARRAARNEDA